jgi:hypothetical protein
VCVGWPASWCSDRKSARLRSQEAACCVVYKAGPLSVSSMAAEQRVPDISGMCVSDCNGGTSRCDGSLQRKLARHSDGTTSHAAPLVSHAGCPSRWTISPSTRRECLPRRNNRRSPCCTAATSARPSAAPRASVWTVWREVLDPAVLAGLTHMSLSIARAALTTYVRCSAATERLAT